MASRGQHVVSQQVEIPVNDLLLDEGNARLGQESSSQQQAALALAEQQGKRLVKLAESILNHGLDPAQLPSVLATGDRRRKYIVIEGNRRVLALKALETPSLVQGALDARDFKRLQTLSSKYLADPIEQITCVLYKQDEADAAFDWVMRRHTGAQEGAGLVEWASDEKDRFAARHGDSRRRSLGGQALDFLEAVEGPRTSTTKVSTSLTRLLTTPEVRERLGLDRVGNELVALHPKDEIAKGLRRIVEDLESEKTKVKDIYTADDRRDYAKTLKRTEMPSKGSRLKEPVRLEELPTGKTTKVEPKKTPRKTLRRRAPRTTVASPESMLNPGPPRLNAIYNELLGLSSEQFPNAGSVLLRVFLELSVDDYITRNNVMTQNDRDNANLAKRLKEVARHLEKTGAIDNQLKRAVNRIADGQHTIAASVTTFHQYVHNQYVHPKPSELRTSWDELRPFLEAVWA
jgi:hypothetical protein